MWITDDTRKHGIADADIERGVRHAMRIIELDEDKTLFIGADHAGRLLELIVADVDSDDAE